MMPSKHGASRSIDGLARVAAWGTLLSAIGASTYLAVVPTYASEAISMSSTGEQRRSSSSATLTAVNGPVVRAWFVVLILLAALPLLFRRTPIARAAAATTAVLLIIFVVLGSASIGGAYTPAAVFALFSAAVTPSSRPAT
jgi:hypothetical protein